MAKLCKIAVFSILIFAASGAVSITHMAHVPFFEGLGGFQKTAGGFTDSCDLFRLRTNPSRQ